MRKIFSLFLISILLVSCKKDKKVPDCKLVSVQSTPGSPVNYEYDNLGRLIKLTTGNTIVNLNYFKDSIVLSSGDIIENYLLNNAGLAVSKKTRFLVNPNSLSIENAYTYDSEGYLINDREIFAQVYNGSVIRDTSVMTYTIQNGNTIKRTYSRSISEDRFEYSSKVAPQNSAFAFGVSRPWTFLGKPSKNLVSTFKDEHDKVTATAFYEFDSKGNVVRQIVRAPDNAVIYTSLYNYQCN